MLSELGFEVTGVDVSREGIEQARRAYPDVRAEIGSCYDDLAGRYGTFPLVISLEVIEHCMEPRAFAETFLSLIAPNGIGILSTPYHGYLKNLALSIANKWDSHHGALWDDGHVKFFSIATLKALFQECGAERMAFLRVGRIPPLAKSVVAVVG
jgi:SAM-dependent methyltransferase